MKFMKLKKLVAELSARKAPEQIKYLDKNCAAIKFLVNVYGKPEIEKALNGPESRDVFVELAKEAKQENDLLARKWNTNTDEHDPAIDVSRVILPDGPDAFDMLPWPLSLNAAHEPIALEIFDRRWAMVKLGGKTRFTTFGATRELDLSAKEDIMLEGANREVVLGLTQEGKPKYVALSVLWMKHPARQQYINGVEFDATRVGNAPGKLNLFTGFDIKPDKDKKWNLFEDHLRDNVCQDGDLSYRWLIAYFAQALQQPMKPPGTVVVLYSKEQGTGKGTVGKVMRHLLGRYSILVGRTEHLTGKFNGHLAGKLLVCGEEAVFSNDKKVLAPLKSLIADPVIPIEEKFNAVVNMPNTLRMLFTTNDPHAAPKEAHDRRFYVIEVGSKRANDAAYFAAIEKQMFEEGGCAGFLHHLLTYPLDADAPEMNGINLRHAPATRAGVQSVVHSLPTEVKGIREILMRGYVHVPQSLDTETLSGATSTSVTKEYVFDDIRVTMKGSYVAGITNSQIGALLAELGWKTTRPRVAGKPVYMFTVPPLTKARELFEAKYGKGTLEGAEAPFDAETQGEDNAGGIVLDFAAQRAAKVKAADFYRRCKKPVAQAALHARHQRLMAAKAAERAESLKAIEVKGAEYRAEGRVATIEKAKAAAARAQGKVDRLEAEQAADLKTANDTLH